jgi:alpha-1,3-rhamnosyl/mannosyltransferase
VRVAVDGRVIRDHFPGIGRYVFRLIQALARVAPGDRFLVLTEPQQHDSRFDLAGLARAANVEMHIVDAPVFGLSAHWRIPRALRGVGVDVYHATYWAGPYWTGVPTVQSVHDLIGLRVAGAVSARSRLLLHLALRLSLRGAGAVTTLSEASRRDLVSHFGLPPEKVVVTPLAPDPAFGPAQAAAVRDLRDRLDLPARYVLYLGSNKPHKNLAVLIEAWAMLSAQARADTALVLAGPWDARFDEPRRAAAALGPRAVRFLGPVAEADLPALYTGAAAFAFPSRAEGFGLPPLEAMACGTPVVLADATSLPEVAGQAALLVGPDDVAGWASALQSVLTDARVAERLASAGRDRAALFRWSETARRTLAAYRIAAGPAR